MVMGLDWSKAKRGHFRGRTFRFVGDPQRPQQPPSSGAFTYRFTFVNSAQLEVAADSEKAARQWVLDYFKWTRMPRGVQIELLAKAA